MKRLIFILIAAVTLFSCNNNPTTQEPTTQTPVTEVKKDHKAALSEVLTATEIQLLTESINGNGNAAAKGKPAKKLSQTITVAPAAMTLTDNGSGSFTINYNGETNIVYTYFRGGDSLGVSGNVYPIQSQSIFTSQPTFTANFTNNFYQGLIVVGSILPDANGVVGADWIFVYTNVVN